MCPSKLDEIKELKRELHKFTITVGDFTIPLSATGRSNRQKITQDADNTSGIINHFTDGCGIQHPAAERTLIPSSRGTFTKRDHILAIEHALTH